MILYSLIKTEKIRTSKNVGMMIKPKILNVSIKNYPAKLFWGEVGGGGEEKKQKQLNFRNIINS